MTTLDLIGGYGRVDEHEQVAIQGSDAAGLRGMEHLMLQPSQAGTGTGERRSSSPPQRQRLEKIQQQQQQQQVDCREFEMTDMTVSKLKKAMSILNRTGHARFRRGPVVAQSQGPPAAGPESATMDFTKSVSGYTMDNSGFSLSGGAGSSFLSSSVMTGDGSVSNGRGGGSSSLVPPPAPGAAQKRECRDHAHSENVPGGKGKYGANGGRCHCSNRRKHRVKRTIRVPAISAKVADIPADDYSWRKYGQKPIKGSPYPRGYYKCSTVRGCPARKHVERDPADPSMLIVTYQGDHRHSPTSGQDPPPPPPELPSH